MSFKFAPKKGTATHAQAIFDRLQIQQRLNADYDLVIAQSLNLVQDIRGPVQEIVNQPLGITQQVIPQHAVPAPSFTDGELLNLLQTVAYAGEGLSGAKVTESAIFDSNTIKGQPLYVPSNGHVDLADSVTNRHVVGLSLEDVTAGNTGQYVTEGSVDRDDWTPITGSTSLTPGAVYYLDSTVGKLTTTPPLGGGSATVAVARALTDKKVDLEVDEPRVAAAGGGGGDDVFVNGSPRSDANFTDGTPAAPGDGVNVRWQANTAAPDNISANVPVGTTSATVVRGNDSRVPSQDENDALQGTDGIPSNANRYVTDSDPRLASKDSISVNGVAAIDANFSDTTPAAPVNSINVLWQKDTTNPDNISANLPFATASIAGVVSTVAQTFAGNKTFNGQTTFNDFVDLAVITEPADPSTGIRLYVVDQNGHPVVEIKGPAGLSRRLARDNIFIAKIDQVGGISAGQVVYISGSQGANELISLARADSDSTMPAAGIAMETGLDNAFIRVLFIGKITKLDTTAFNEGDRLFVSASTAGAFTATEPNHPNLKQRIGIVTRSNPSNGEILLIPAGVRGDHEGTNRNEWKIGDDTAGAKDVVFRNGNDLTLSANPTAARVATIPDGTFTFAAHAGDISAGTALSPELAANTVTFAKMQDITSDRLIGRDTAASGDPEEITVGGGIEFTGAGGIQRSALTGDVTASAGSNSTTIPNNTVTFAKMQDITSDRLIGRDTAASGDPEEIIVGGGIEFTGTGEIQRSALTGDVTASAGSNATTIPNNTVTFAKMQDVSAASRLIGRGSAAGAGDPEEITLGAGLTMTGTTLSAAGGGGDNVSVNSVAASDANFSDTTPTAPVNSINVLWQKDTTNPDNISANVPFATGSIAGVVSTGVQTFAGIKTFIANSIRLGDNSAGAKDFIFQNGFDLVVRANPTANRIVTVPDGTFTFAAHAGDISAGTALSPTIAENAVTFAKMQDITSDRLIGRDTAATGDPEEITVGGGVEFTGAGGIQRSALTGDVTASAGSNSTTIPGNTVTFAKMQDINTDRLIGRDTAATGDPEEITVGGGVEFTGAGGIQRSALTGDVTASAGSNATTIPNNTVTFAKMQDVSAASRLVGRGSAAGAGDPEEITLGTGLTMTGTTLSATGGGGGSAPKQVEIDFGATPVIEKEFTITDAAVNSTMKVIGDVAYEAPTGKSLDELEMDHLDLKFRAGTGQVILRARGMEGSLHGNFKINYLVG